VPIARLESDRDAHDCPLGEGGPRNLASAGTRHRSRLRRRYRRIGEGHLENLAASCGAVSAPPRLVSLCRYQDRHWRQRGARDLARNALPDWPSIGAVVLIRITIRPCSAVSPFRSIVEAIALCLALTLMHGGQRSPLSLRKNRRRVRDCVRDNQFRDTVSGDYQVPRLRSSRIASAQNSVHFCEDRADSTVRSIKRTPRAPSSTVG